MPSDEALEFFAQKLGADLDELATGRPEGLAQELKLQLQEARHGIARGRLKEAQITAQGVIRKAKTFQLPRITARGYEIDALAHERQGNLEGAIRRYERSVETIAGDAPTAWAVAVAGQVRCLNEFGEAHHAVFMGENYLERLKRERMSSPSAVLRVRSSLVLAYLGAGSHKKAAQTADECQRLIPKVNDPLTLAIAYVNVAAVQKKQGQHADADIALAKAEELFEALDLINETGIAVLARGYNLARSGKEKQARPALEKASALLKETGHHAQHLNAEIEIARLDRLEGRLDQAAARLEASLELLVSDTQPRVEAWAHRELGLILIKRDKTRATKHLKKALELYELQGNPLEVARTHILMAEQRGARDTKGRLEEYQRAAEAVHQMPEM